MLKKEREGSKKIFQIWKSESYCKELQKETANEDKEH